MPKRVAPLVLAALYVAGLVYGTIFLFLKPAPPKELPAPPVSQPALTSHLLLVVVDGLRYDIATDALRMPRFARAMREEQSALVLAGKVSMTSAAVQNYGTGQRGRFEQIVRNINAAPPPFSSWLENARQKGLDLGVVGDPAWIQMFGKSFREQRPDPPGVALDRDYNDQTLRDARELLAKQPNFLVVHFVTPDHQGHSYGISSPRYRAHILDFDRKLFEFLADVGRDWTVFVTSDHGAADSGTHGADVPVQRRSPIFAYGPGIAPPLGDAQSRRPSTPLDQADLANTFAALLGVPAAAHSQGHVLADWLSLSELERARLLCADGERALTFAEAARLGEAAKLAPELRRACARVALDSRRAAQVAWQVVSRIDDGLTLQQGVYSPRSWAFLLAVCGGALICALAFFPRAGALRVSSCLAVAACAVLLVSFVEHLPGAWPKRADATLFVVFNAPTLLLLVWPERLIALFERAPAVAVAVAPGMLAVTYPTNLQPVAYSVTLVVALLCLGSRSFEQLGLKLRASARPGRSAALAILAVAASCLFPAGTRADGMYGALWHDARLLGPLAAALIALFVWQLHQSRPALARYLVLGAACAVGSLAARRFAAPWLGRPLLLALPVLGYLAYVRGQRELGRLCLLIGFVWVSRDVEVVVVLAATSVAALVAERARYASPSAWSGGRILLMLGFWFALAFVQRLGVSGGLDPIALDLGAGAFGDPNVPAWWITAALIWKYLLAFLLLALTLLSNLPLRVTKLLASGFIVLGLGRAATLLAMMQGSRGSFWTSLRVMGDLPFALAFAVGAALCLAFLRTPPTTSAAAAAAAAG